MPLLDFSEVIRDAVEFLDVFKVTRSTQTVDSNGRAVNTTKMYPNIFGIVRTSTSAALNFFPEAEHLTGDIVIMTGWRLTAARPADNIDADIVHWNKRDYIVTQIGDWSRMGTGYIVALCSLRDVDQ